MECKGTILLVAISVMCIGIYPEWNVKFSKCDELGNAIILEYIQNGM